MRWWQWLLAWFGLALVLARVAIRIAFGKRPGPKYGSRAEGEQ